MRYRFIYAPLLCLVLILIQYQAHSQCWPLADKLIPNKSYNNKAGFGKSIGYEDNIAVVGAPDSDTLMVGSGIAYVFQFDGNNWIKIASLAPSDYRQSQAFGQTVMIRNDHIYVSDPSYTEGGTMKGRIYIFEKPATGWHDMQETSTMTTTDPNARGFGGAMDIFENTMIVGALSSVDDNNTSVGAAYIFQFQNNTWTQIAKFSSSYSLGSAFGSNVAIGKNLAVVVAAEETATYTELGASYVFEKDPASSWVNSLPVARLTKNSTDISPDELGHGLAIDETRQTIFIAENVYAGNSNYGKAVRTYVRPSGGWSDMTESAVYINTELSSVNSQSLKFEEPYLYFAGGATIKIFAPDNADSWVSLNPITSLEASDYTNTLSFGSSLAIKNGHVLAGAPIYISVDIPVLVSFPSPGAYEFIMPATGWTNSSYSEDHRFTYMPMSASNFYFGSVIDVDGDYAVIGSPEDNNQSNLSGIAYVYHLENVGWKRIAKLSPSDGEPFDLFGGSVAISGDHIAVSAVRKSLRSDNGQLIDFNLGAVYLFEKPSGGWSDMTENYKLVKSDGKYDDANNDREDDDFGEAIDMDFPYLIVSRFDAGSRPNTGSVFVYNLSNQIPAVEATLNPSTRDETNNFGISLKIVGNTIAAASGGLRGWLVDANHVFIYTKSGNNWVDSYESATLYPSDAGENGIANGISFGNSIDMNTSATKIIVGAPGWYGSESSIGVPDLFKGAAYIYEKPDGGWVGHIPEKVMLTVKDQPPYGCMGVSVHIEDNYATVGSPQNYVQSIIANVSGPGRVYFYQMPDNGWAKKEPDKIILGNESTSSVSDYFGSSIAATNGYLLIGAYGDNNQNSIKAGAVYVYSQYPLTSPMPTLCGNQNPIQLTAYPAGGQWSGPGTSASGIFNPSLSGNGTFQIHYKVDDCDASSGMTINVKEFIEPFSLTPTDSVFFCGAPNITLTSHPGSNLEYQWAYSKTGADYSLINNAIASTLQVSDEGFYKSLVKNDCSSQSDSTWVGNLYPNAGPDLQICNGSETTLLIGNYSKGFWSGDGISTNGTFSPSTAGLGAHTVYYSVSPSTGCLYQDTMQVNVNGISQLSITSVGDDTFCYNGLSVLTATSLPDATYNWYFQQSDSSYVSLNETSHSLNAHDLGVYKVTASEGQCPRDAFHRITSSFNPTVSPLFDSLSFCQTAPIKIEAQQIQDADYTWSLLNGESLTVMEETVGSFSTQIEESGKYSLKITSHGCEFKSPEMKAYKIPADSLFVPNLITPNGDNKNDSFKIYASESIETYSLVIVNRYGTEVYRYTGGDRTPGWTGGDLSDGVYFLFLVYQDSCGNKPTAYKGTVTILK